METLCRCQRHRKNTVAGYVRGNKRKEISKAQHENRTKEIREGAVTYVEQHDEHFEGFLVTEKRDQ
jgi:hypothetical protein